MWWKDASCREKKRGQSDKAKRKKPARQGPDRYYELDREVDPRM